MEKINLNLDKLNLSNEVYKEIVKFLIDNSHINLTDDIFTKLSEENKFYVIKNNKNTVNKNYDEVIEISKESAKLEEDFELC
jgi:chaperonin cofactor prefoldin